MKLSQTNLLATFSVGARRGEKPNLNSDLQLLLLLHGIHYILP